MTTTPTNEFPIIGFALLTEDEGVAFTTKDEAIEFQKVFGGQVIPIVNVFAAAEAV